MTSHDSRDQVIRSADGTRLTVRRVGAGDPVLLLHGSGGGLHTWAAVADRLADTYEVWMLARRGYGPSDVPSGVKSFADEVADVRAVIAATGRPVHLAGGSYGATLALHTALTSPDDLRSLALFEPPLYAAGARTRPLLDQYRAAFERDDAPAMAATRNEVTQVPAEVLAAMAATATAPKPDPVEARRAATGWLHDLEALAADDPDPARWSSITVPTLLMQGAQTWEPMPSTIDALARAMPAARRVSWAEHSHFVIMTAPELFADELRQFFKV